MNVFSCFCHYDYHLMGICKKNRSHLTLTHFTVTTDVVMSLDRGDGAQPRDIIRRLLVTIDRIQALHGGGNVSVQRPQYIRSNMI